MTIRVKGRAFDWETASIRERDAAIATAIYGERVTWVDDDKPHWWPSHFPRTDGVLVESEAVPRFTTKIEDAWTVRSMMKQKGFLMLMSDASYCYVRFTNQDMYGQASEERGAEAICRAALRAMEAMDDI